jgi:ADP-heptose:LPS heptosyltransferase
MPDASTEPAPQSDRPVLVVLRALGLGDLLTAVPALHALSRSRSAHRLVLATPSWLEPVVGLVGGVHAVLPTSGVRAPLRMPAGEADIAVNLHGRGLASTRLLDALGARLKIGHREPGWPGPVWQDGQHERVRWSRLMEAHGMPADPGDIAIARPALSGVPAGAGVVHVGAAYGSRRWPTDRFAAVARALSGDGRQVVVSGGAADRGRAAAVVRAAGLPGSANLAGRLGLAEFAVLIADAGVLVSADTGAAHLASAYRTPSVVLFGPVPPSLWGPPADGPHIALTGDPFRAGDPFADHPDPALLAVTAADVIAAVASLGRMAG